METSDLNPLGRFSDRVEDYVRFRPGYPPALIEYLRRKVGLSRQACAADVGSGTGIFTRLLLQAAGEVYAVEPNGDMRAAAEAQLRGEPGFHSMAGTAEATGLPEASVSLVTCAQAFHWFDVAGTRREFMRILVPGGWCALIWNTHKRDGSPFALGYERIRAEFGTDFHKIRHENRPAERFTPFFGHDAWEKRLFANSQTLDYPGLRGRLLSSSYAPKEGHPRHLSMLAALRDLFARCQRNGAIRLDYDTELYLGQFA